MICPRCGMEALPDHACPREAMERGFENGDATEFFDIYLIRINHLEQTAAIKAYLQDLLPHLTEARINNALAQLPIVLQRTQPKEQALKVKHDLEFLGVQVQIKPLGPAQPKPDLTDKKISASPIPPAQDKEKNEPGPAPEPKKRPYFINPLWGACLLIALAAVMTGILKYKMPYWLRLVEPLAKPPAVQALPKNPSAKKEGPAAGKPANKHDTAAVIQSPEQKDKSPKLDASSGQKQDLEKMSMNAAPSPDYLKAVEYQKEGRDNVEKRQYKEALDSFNKALKLVPNEPIIKKDLSFTLCEMAWESFKKSEYDDARSLFKESLFYDSMNSDAVRGMGYIGYENNDNDEAEKWLKKYFDMSGGHPEAYVLLGNVYYQKNDLDQALSFYRMALELSPGDKRIIPLIQKVEREKGVEAKFSSADNRHFVVKYEGLANMEIGNIIFAILEDAYVKISPEFGYYPKKPITAIVYTNKQFQSVINAPDWAGAIYDGKIRIPSGGIHERSEMLERAVFHEYTHALIHERTKGNIPTWFNEGLAQLYEGPALPQLDPFFRDLAHPGRLAALRRLERPFVTMPQNNAQMAYAESLLAVQFIHDSYGYDAISQMLEELGSGKSMEQAIHKILALSYEQLDERFAEWVKNQYGEQQ